MSLVDKLSIQLYSARHVQPLARQFEIIAGLGYAAVEPHGALFDDIDGLVALLDAHGMSAPSMHVGLARLESDAHGVAGWAMRLGADLVVAPYLAEGDRPTDAEGWRVLGRRLAAVRRALETKGVRFAWHNHDFEFVTTSDGACPLVCLFEADPGLLWEADIGWIHRAGEDPVGWLDAWRDRVAACHIKDIAPAGENLAEDGWADVGSGVIDWATILTAIRPAGNPILVVEHDNPSDVERFARRSRASVTRW